ncbi:MAG: hypothetical protein HN577_12320, partial [Rhodospirillaceae bacterium]|nr:hypothetical protein [Rhodospirillaceae bacterium]
MPETPAATVWQEVCGHINAAAFGPVIGALESGAVLERLLDAPEGREVDALAYETGTRSGLLHLAARLFELEGLGCRSGNLADCRTNWRLTQAGKKRVEGGVREALDRGECSSRLAQAMARIYRGRATSELAKDNLATLVWSEELAVLGQAGWAERRDGLWRLNERGNTALPMAAQFLYTDGYLPLLARAPELILGQTPYDLGRDGEGEETHVDRETDIAFSGLVFRHTCKDAFLELALPLFSSPARPSAVVDTGAGDGELLLVLAEALRQNGLPPVTMIAVEFNEVARSVAAHRLAEAGARHLAIRGDIGAPDAIAEALSTHGIDMADACHVSKSVIHNRS